MNGQMMQQPLLISSLIVHAERHHPERGQRLGHLARARGEILVGAAMNVAFDAARDDLLFAVVALGVHQLG